MNAQATISLLNVLVPILTPVLGAIAMALRDRRSRRSDIGRRKLALEDARAQVEFVNDWWNARKAIDVSGGPGSPSSQEAERQARAWLDRASERVTDNELSLPPVEPAMTVRTMALLYPFRTTAGRLARAVFWVFCGITTTTVGATISEWLAPPGDYALGPVDSADVRSFVIAGAVITPLTVGLRFLAVAVDDAAAQPNDPRRQTHGFGRELFLLRRLQGRGAGTLRVAFYLGAVWVVANVALGIRVGLTGPNLYWLPLSMTGLVAYGTATFALRAWAVSIDRTARRPSVPSQETARDQVTERTFAP
ncbi:MAG: hypothetical protein WAL50_10850 [Kineosporiaceae bacterium]